MCIWTLLKQQIHDFENNGKEDALTLQYMPMVALVNSYFPKVINKLIDTLHFLQN